MWDAHTLTKEVRITKMKLDVSCDLPCELAQAKQAVKTLGLLNYVATPVMQFECVDSLEEKTNLEARIYIMKAKLFGFLPLGLHTMEFSYLDSIDQFVMRDNGRSGLCKKWDHIMTFQKREQGVHYRDGADIQAGILTPLIWLFALFFYKHRQRRWKRLAIYNFRNLNSSIR